MKPGIPLALAFLVLAAPGFPGTGEEPPAKSHLSRLQGRALAGRRDAVVGATVMVQLQEDGSRRYLTSSGEGGDFAVDGLPDGEYRVRVARPGLSPVDKERIQVRFPFRAVVEVTMQPRPGEVETADAAGPPPAGQRITLQGRIREEGDKPMPEVRVRLVRADGSLDPRSQRTSADGQFAFSDLEPGAWRVEIRGVGFLPIRQTLEVGVDTDLDVTMVAQPPQYVPSPWELMPPERPVPPEGFDSPG